jgi:hypothetical protein
MTKKLVLSIVAIMACKSFLSAERYVNIGAAYVESIDKVGFTTQVGWTINNSESFNAAMELDVSYYEKYSIDVIPAMANFKLSTNQSNNVNAYLGFGFGAIIGDGPRGTSYETFALQGLVGAVFEISDTADYKIGYRYLYDHKLDTYDNIGEMGISFAF